MGVDLKEQGTNVFNLTLEEPKKEPEIVFNPTEELLTVLERFNSIETLVAAKLFKPETIDTFNRNSSTKVLNYLKNELRKKKTKGPSEFANTFVDCIQIYPEYFCNVNPEDIYPLFKRDLVSSIDTLAPQSDPGFLLRTLANHKIMYPGKEFLRDPEKYKEYFREDIEDLLEERVIHVAVENIFYWNVLFPQETIRPTDEALREAREFLSKLIELRAYPHACQLAVNLYYVTSGRIEVGTSGLVLSEEKPVLAQVAAMPAERSF